MMRDSKPASGKKDHAQSTQSSRERKAKTVLNQNGRSDDSMKPGAGKSERLTREVKGLFQTLADPKNRKFVAFSVLVHLIVVIAFVVNWDSDGDKKKVTIPKSMSVRAATAEELAAIANAKNKIKERKEAEKQKQALAKKKEKERKRKKEAERKKKQEELKRKNKAKKELERKKKVEAAKKKKALEEKKKKAAENAKKEKLAKEEKRRKEELEKKVEAAKLAAEKKRSEDKLRERIEKIKEMQAAKRAAEAGQSKLDAAAEQELTEIEYYMGVIRARIENRWRVPPRTKNLRVVLRIKLLPTGELSEVSLAKSSGVTAFDNSALHAVNNVGKFPVPKDNQIFERNFRTFSMGFTSPDDGL